MKFIKEYIDREEDWEEEDPDNKNDSGLYYWVYKSSDIYYITEFIDDHKVIIYKNHIFLSTSKIKDILKPLTPYHYEKLKSGLYMIRIMKSDGLYIKITYDEFLNMKRF